VPSFLKYLEIVKRSFSLATSFGSKGETDEVNSDIRASYPSAAAILSPKASL